jgi:hypothetical protein
MLHALDQIERAVAFGGGGDFGAERQWHLAPGLDGSASAVRYPRRKFVVSKGGCDELNSPVSLRVHAFPF